MEQIIEVWKDINGFEGIYQISNLGRVKSLARLSIQKHPIDEKILKTALAGNTRRNKDYGYLEVSLYKDGQRYHRKIHRLVAEAFVDNPCNYKEVDHIDGDKLNNHYTNLRWVTRQQNQSNPLLVEKLRQCNIGKKQSEESIRKRCQRIAVIKDGVILHIFDSYKDLDENSEAIIGVKLWNIYARQCAVGKRKMYKGFQYKLIDKESVTD